MVGAALETAYSRGLVGHPVVAYITLAVLFAILVQILLLVVGGVTQLAKRMSRLVHAAKFNYIQEVQRLLEHGEYVDATDEHGRPAVIYAASKGHARILQLLLRKAADATRLDKGGFTALHGAVYNGHTQCVTLLLQTGNCGVDVQTLTGDTALHLAAYRGHVDIVRLLIRAKANPHIKNSKNRDAVQEATNEKHRDILQHLKKYIADNPPGCFASVTYPRQFIKSSNGRVADFQRPIVTGPTHVRPSSEDLVNGEHEEVFANGPVRAVNPGVREPVESSDQDTESADSVEPRSDNSNWSSFTNFSTPSYRRCSLPAYSDTESSSSSSLSKFGSGEVSPAVLDSSLLSVLPQNLYPSGQPSSHPTQPNYPVGRAPLTHFSPPPSINALSPVQAVNHQSQAAVNNQKPKPVEFTESSAGLNRKGTWHGNGSERRVKYPKNSREQDLLKSVHQLERVVDQLQIQLVNKQEKIDRLEVQKKQLLQRIEVLEKEQTRRAPTSRGEQLEGIQVELRKILDRCFRLQANKSDLEGVLIDHHRRIGAALDQLHIGAPARDRLELRDAVGLISHGMSSMSDSDEIAEVPEVPDMASGASAVPSGLTAYGLPLPHPSSSESKRTNSSATFDLFTHSNLYEALLPALKEAPPTVLESMLASLQDKLSGLLLKALGSQEPGGARTTGFRGEHTWRLVETGAYGLVLIRATDNGNISYVQADLSVTQSTSLDQLVFTKLVHTPRHRHAGTPSFMTSLPIGLIPDIATPIPGHVVPWSALPVHLYLQYCHVTKPGARFIKHVQYGILSALEHLARQSIAHLGVRPSAVQVGQALRIRLSGWHRARQMGDDVMVTQAELDDRKLCGWLPPEVAACSAGISTSQLYKNCDVYSTALAILHLVDPSMAPPQALGSSVMMTSQHGEVISGQWLKVLRAMLHPSPAQRIGLREALMCTGILCSGVNTREVGSAGEAAVWLQSHVMKLLIQPSVAVDADDLSNEDPQVVIECSNSILSQDIARETFSRISAQELWWCVQFLNTADPGS